ncbi:MAG: 1,4-beta-xylanase, partial [Planctomycetota bacterium]
RELGKPGALYVFVNGGPVSHYNMPDDPAAQGASVFINELIPHIDKTYRTIASREHRGIEGFSQGGRGTMRLSLRHADLFLSSAPGGGGYETERKISESGGYESEKLKFARGDNVYDLARDYAQRRKQASVPAIKLQLHVGTKGFNYENNLAYMEYLDSLAIPYAKVIVPEAPHSASKIYHEAARQLVDFHLTNFGQ